MLLIFKNLGLSEKVAKRSPDFRTIVVWLERIEDMYHFPFGKRFIIKIFSNYL